MMKNNTNNEGDPCLSIVMLTHNRCEELCRSLTQLCALPEQPPIIVVDNGSTDGTYARIAADYPSVTLVRSDCNLGAAGRNLGVAQAHTPYIAFSDDDTWWAPGALRLAQSLLILNPGVAVLNARILVGPEEKLDPACATMENSPFEPLPGLGPMLTSFMAGAIVMRKRAFMQAGGYWDAFHIGGEETLLAMDILNEGGLIAYAPQLVVHHWPSQSRDTRTRQRLLARNAIWTAWLRLPAGMAWRRTQHILKQQTSIRPRLRAVSDALSGTRLIWTRRRVLHKGICAMVERAWLQECH